MYSRTKKPGKDIGDYQFKMPTYYPLPLESCEQQVLKQIRATLGDGPFSESKLLFAPRWIIDKAISEEKKSYMTSVQPVCRPTLLRSANVVPSHHFFTVKYDVDTGNLKPRCRVVPHGNMDQLKGELRSDSSTAQFPVIRTVLSIAVIHKLKLARLISRGLPPSRRPATRYIHATPYRLGVIAWRSLEAAQTCLRPR